MAAVKHLLGQPCDRASRSRGRGLVETAARRATGRPRGDSSRREETAHGRIPVSCPGEIACVYIVPRSPSSSSNGRSAFAALR